MTARKLLEKRISEVLQDLGAPTGTPALVGPATRPEFGDYQANGAMAAAKKLKSNPRGFAEKVVDKLDLSDLADSVELAGPGFINITLKSEWISEYLDNALADSRLGVEVKDPPQTIVVDYSHPNLAKEMHVGHLRSTIIGDAMVAILEFLGHSVIRHNHIGDWGTQFGMLIAYMDHLADKGEPDLSTDLADLEGFYRDAKQLFDRDPGFAELSRAYVVKLQSGDTHSREIWQSFIEESLQHCELVYNRLGVSLKRSDVRPESSYNDDLPAIIDDLDKKGLLIESEGAKCVFLDEFKGKDGELIPAIVQKSDGGYLYATTDLAAVRYRAQVLKADRILYIVDARQTLHLKQVFAISHLSGFASDHSSLEHLAFGTMLGKDGKPFKTRQGGTVKLTDLLDGAEKRAFDLVSKKNPDLSEDGRRQIARVVGIGSIKYADLSLNRTTDYVFDWDRMLSLDGNTAPYMQYSYARVKSIFRKGELAEEASPGHIIFVEPAEKSLGVKLLQFAETLESVSTEGFPNLLCNYLYELAKIFMKFYESCPVLKSDEPVRTSRLMLCLLTAKTIKTGLGLLGIETVERM